MFSDLNDGGTPMFLYNEGNINIESGEDFELSFIPEANNVVVSQVQLSVWPTYHNYSPKELFYNILKSNNMLGDINGDQLINVLDIVTLVGMILSNEYSEAADINDDLEINVIDVVQLVNIILN